MHVCVDVHVCMCQACMHVLFVFVLDHMLCICMRVFMYIAPCPPAVITSRGKYLFYLLRGNTPYPRTRTHQVGKYEEKMKARETEVADGLARIEILTAEIDLQNQVRIVALPRSV
jgi:hypothetical protein